MQCKAEHMLVKGGSSHADIVPSGGIALTENVLDEESSFDSFSLRSVHNVLKVHLKYVSNLQKLKAIYIFVRAMQKTSDILFQGQNSEQDVIVPCITTLTRSKYEE